MTNSDVLKRFDARFNWASFCWNGDNETGEKAAKKSYKDARRLLLQALEAKDRRVLSLIDSLQTEARRDRETAHSGYYIRALTDLRTLLEKETTS